MAEGSTATRKRASSNGNAASARASNGSKAATKKPASAAKKTAGKTAAKPDESGGSVTEKLKLAAIAGGSAAVGAAGGYAGASLSGGGSKSRSTVKVPKFKTSTSVKLIAAAAKIGYSVGRTRQKLAS